MGRGFGGRGFGGGGGSGGYRGGSGRYGRGGRLISKIVMLVLCGITLIVTSIIQMVEERPFEIRDSTQHRTAISHELSADSPTAYFYFSSLMSYKSKSYFAEKDSSLYETMSDFYEATGIVPYLYSTDTGHKYRSTNPAISAAAINLMYGDLFPIPPDLDVNSPPDTQEYQTESNTINVTRMPTDEEAQKICKSFYDRNFKDEGHLFILHIEEDGYSANRKSKVWYYAGEEADKVFDREAGEIFLDAIELSLIYSKSNQIKEKDFTFAFDETHKRIMAEPTGTHWTVYAAVIGGGVVLVALVVGFTIYFKRKAKRNKEELEIK